MRSRSPSPGKPPTIPPWALGIYRAAVRGAARASGTLSRMSGIGGGTSVPGVVIERLDPGFVARRAEGFPGGVVLVSGTNGKTTTVAMIRSILKAHGTDTVSNESGANLFRGVATALLLKPHGGPVGVFESDEAVLERLVVMLQPRALVLTNIFRDQLDRFAEPERVARMFRTAAAHLPEGAVVIANVDDPLLWSAVEEFSPIGYGVHPTTMLGGSPDAEPEICSRCGGPLVMDRRTIVHLGRASCPTCGWKSTRPVREAQVISTSSLGATRLRIDDQLIDVSTGGLYNAYNAVAAVATTEALGVPSDIAIRSLGSFRARFGRCERFDVDGRSVWLMLMKNPASAGVLSHQLAEDRDLGAVVVAVNDRTADGRDISWIWDSDFERLAGLGIPLVPSGVRAADVAVRLKYAGAERVRTEPRPFPAIRDAIALSPSDRSIAVMATYTAMLDVREALLGSTVTRLEDAKA
jgi:lipid II isoglutaminyl synthase (glutamine-hydrolysing)